MVYWTVERTVTACLTTTVTQECATVIAVAMEVCADWPVELRAGELSVLLSIGKIDSVHKPSGIITIWCEYVGHNVWAAIFLASSLHV